MKNEGGATKDSGKSNANNKEWLYKISLTKTTGQKCCTVVRDCQLRPFDYVMEPKSELEEEKTESSTEKDSNMPASADHVGGTNVKEATKTPEASIQLDFANSQIEDLKTQLKQLEKEANEQLSKSKSNKKKKKQKASSEEKEAK